jgi:D-alanine-D-alanine ligase
MSGREVAAALRESGRFNVREQIIDRPDVEELRRLLDSSTGSVSNSNHQKTTTDVVFPVLHGHWGEGGPLQDLLEVIGVPYVGSRPKAARLAMDKLVTKTMISGLGIATPPSRQLMPDDECDLEPPLVLKPVDDGSSVDLRICHTTDEMVQARRELHPRRGRLMAEHYVRGREITTGIVRGEALPLIEIVPSEAVTFYDYEAKYERDDTRYIVDPALPEEVAGQCRDWALQVFHLLGCRDVARVDFMVDDAGPWFLEINTMPGFTTHSLVPMAACHVGQPMAELCASLVEAATARGPAPAGVEAMR